MPNAGNDHDHGHAYAELLKIYWQEAPGQASIRLRSSLERLSDFATEGRLDQIAVTLASVASEGLLLGGNFLAGGFLENAWAELDKAQKRAYVAYRIYWLEAWMPSAYASPIFGYAQLCAFFSLAMARSEFSQATWYAQQIYNLRRGGLADDSCEATEYVEFYWELAIAWLNRRWPQQSELSDHLGPYLGLLDGSTLLQHDSLVQCASYHLNIAANADSLIEHPYASRYVGHVCYELMGWLALKKYIDGDFSPVSGHPMLVAGVLSPVAQKDCPDPLLIHIEQRAVKQYGDEWDLPARSFDVQWPNL